MHRHPRKFISLTIRVSSCLKIGPVAQLGECYNGIVEVARSIRVGSTKTKRDHCVWKICFFTGILFHLGCASIHGGANYAKNEKGESIKKGGLIASGIENKRLGSKYFLALDFTFENTTEDWMQVVSARVTFGKSSIDDAMKVPVGQDLNAWVTAAHEKAAISDYNSSLIASAVMGVGAAAMSSKDTNELGKLAVIGGGSALTIQSLNNNYDSLQKAKILPETHLYSSGFVIPPGLHTKK